MLRQNEYEKLALSNPAFCTLVSIVNLYVIPPHWKFACNPPPITKKFPTWENFWPVFSATKKASLGRLFWPVNFSGFHFWWIFLNKSPLPDHLVISPLDLPYLRTLQKSKLNVLGSKVLRSLPNAILALHYSPEQNDPLTEIQTKTSVKVYL